jgi:hypothetical protein
VFYGDKIEQKTDFWNGAFATAGRRLIFQPEGFELAWLKQLFAPISHMFSLGLHLRFERS